MDFSLFGFEFKKRQDKTKEPVSFAEPENDDGASIVSSSASYYGIYMDIDGTVKNDLQNLQTYRTIALYPDVDIAIQDIVDEAVPNEDNTDKVRLNLDNFEQPDKVKDIFQEEFKHVLRLLKFDSDGADIFRRWYIDGRLYYHIIPSANPKQFGIQELRQVEASRIKKVREVEKEKQGNIDVIKKVNEYFLYTDYQNALNQQNGMVATTTNAITGLKIQPDSIIYVPSGFIDHNTGTLLSYLHKAIRPANQLRMLEDALVVYRVSRAPERRVFYIDVGNLPRAKAEQHLKDIMNRYRNKLVYDAKTGEVRDDKKYMSMLEDFWLPRREGGKGTQIDVLPGAQNLGELTDVSYFQDKLWQSLNIPVSRLRPETGISLGNSQNISRDEVKFQKFIEKLRKKFALLLLDAFKTQLILKGIITPEDWDDLKDEVKLEFQKDNYFAEIKNLEILNTRLMAAQQADPYIGKYFSVEFIRKKILQLSDDECEKLDQQVEVERQMHPYWYINMMNPMGMQPTEDGQEPMYDPQTYKPQNSKDEEK